MPVHIIAPLLPAALLALACAVGGGWVWLALLSITALVYAMDRVLPQEGAVDHPGNWTCWAIAAAHFPLLGLGVYALGSGHVTGPERVALGIGLGLWFGQVANSTAHELIHRPGRTARRLGIAIFASLLNGHHVSAHLRVHHVHAATDADPNSARKGEGFYAYLLRAVPGEFIAGYRAEKALRNKAKTGDLHPYATYLSISAASVLAACLLAGVGGGIALVSLAAYAHLQLLLSDYVQHYGLRRRRVGDRLEPVGPQHSWNAPQIYSGAMMLNAPRHSDHHMAPAKPHDALAIDTETMPVLPRSLPVMATVALVPPLWRRMMDRRVDRWSTQSRDPFTKAPHDAGAGASVLSG